MTKLRVLFLCVHNSARSILAEALLRDMAGDRFEVLSAGSEPTRPHPLALRVLADEGLDVTGLRSKSIGTLLNQPFDSIITLCAEAVCPVFPGQATRLHWALPDPAAVEGTTEERLEAFSQTAAALKQRLREFIAGAMATPSSV